MNKHPTRDFSPIQREFIRFIFSRQGQALVEKDGYVPISAEFAKQELAKVGIE